MKEHRILSPHQEAAAEDRLFRAILTLRSVEECRAFFRDLCTPAELQALKDRWAVAEMLAEGQLTYRQIHDRSGVSVTTIGRVARCLNAADDGYGTALKRLSR
jgi:TrpR-related protein YerC/YecD